MTDQITVPRETWSSVLEALMATEFHLVEMGQRHNGLHKQCVDAITAANAVLHPKPETAPVTEGGAITSESAANAVIAWEATTPVYTKYVTDKRYRSFSDAAKRWYKPYKCSSCQQKEPHE